MKSRGGPDLPVAKRLRQLRTAQGFPGRGGQTAFANHVGLGVKRYSNFENGYPIPRQAMDMILEKVPGVYEWLKSGNEEHLSGTMLSKLRAAAASVDEADKEAG